MSRIEHAAGSAAEVVHRDPRPGDVKHSQADNASLRALFPDVSPVSLDEGLAETVTWFKEIS